MFRKLSHYFVMHGHALKQGFRHLQQTPISTLITFLIIGMVLSLPMGLFLFLQNIQIATQSLKQTNQISVYLSQKTTGPQIAQLKQSLNQNDAIASVQYISPDAGLAEFEKNMNSENIIAQLKNNPLPPVFIVAPKADIASPDDAKQLVAQLQNLPNVTSVDFDTAWLSRLQAILNLGHQFTEVLMILFFGAALLIIHHTIQLMMREHQEEIFITQLLGGTSAFIRRPFLYSGILYGFVGSLITIFLLQMILWFLTPALSQLSTLYSSPFELQSLATEEMLLFVAASSFLGALGSWLAASRCL